MPATPTETPTLRIGARVLLFDQDDRVLLIHAKDPDVPDITGGSCPAAVLTPARTYPTLPAANWLGKPASSSITSDPTSGTARPASATEVKNITAARPSTSPALLADALAGRLLQPVFLHA